MTTSSHEALAPRPLPKVSVCSTSHDQSAPTRPSSLADTGRSIIAATIGSALTDSIHSQGAALIAAAVSDLSSTVRNQVQGAVLFGYTKNQQNGGRIPNYPTDRTRIYCAQGDRVCEGTLIVAPPHFSYDDEARGVAATFLASRI